jgi:hypothetical protein
MTVADLQTFQFGSRVKVTQNGKEGVGFVEDGETLNLWVLLDEEDLPVEIHCAAVQILSPPEDTDQDLQARVNGSQFMAGFTAALLVMARMISQRMTPRTQPSEAVNA